MESTKTTPNEALRLVSQALEVMKTVDGVWVCYRCETVNKLLQEAVEKLAICST